MSKWELLLIHFAITSAYTDLRFPLDGGIELSFSQGGDDPPRAVSNVSCDRSPCPLSAWDSYETLQRRDASGEFRAAAATRSLIIVAARYKGL